MAAKKKKVEATQCPEGHTLPRDGCTPLYCGMVTSITKAKKEKPQEPGDAEVRERLSFPISRLRVRDEMLPVPNVTGAEAEKYVEEKKVELLPRAMQEVEFQLKYGDDKQRIEASRDVLRMNGMLNRDAPTGMGPTVVINMGNGASFPWLKKKEDSNAQVVEATPSGRKEG